MRHVENFKDSKDLIIKKVKLYNKLTKSPSKTYQAVLDGLLEQTITKDSYKLTDKAILSLS